MSDNQQKKKKDGRGGKRKNAGRKKKHVVNQSTVNRGGNVSGFFDGRRCMPAPRAPTVEDANAARQKAANEAAASAETRRVTEETAARREEQQAQARIEREERERERGKKLPPESFVSKNLSNRTSTVPEVQPPQWTAAMTTKNLWMTMMKIVTEMSSNQMVPLAELAPDANHRRIPFCAITWKRRKPKSQVRQPHPGVANDGTLLIFGTGEGCGSKVFCQEAAWVHHFDPFNSSCMPKKEVKECECVHCKQTGFLQSHQCACRPQHMHDKTVWLLHK